MYTQINDTSSQPSIIYFTIAITKQQQNNKINTTIRIQYTEYRQE